MGNKNRNRGFSFEREIVNAAKDAGFDAKRAWGSNGEAMGEVKEVDVVVGPYRFQCKRHKSLPKWATIDKGVDMVAFREDRGSTRIMMSLETFLSLLKEAKVEDRWVFDSKKA